MIYGSVCSGIEAATVAWHPLGWKPAWFAEIDKFPSAVLAHHYPSTPNLGDFTEIQSDAGPIDLLVGGTPCQDFSVAGRGSGFSGLRGTLTHAYADLVSRLSPRWFVWENVPGVFSAKHRRGLLAFFRRLSEIGYVFGWRILDAQYVRVDGLGRAVPQRRRRVFVVGHLGDWRRAAAVLFEPESMRGDSAPSRKAGPGVAALTANGVGTCGPDDNQAQAGHLIDCPDVSPAIKARDYKGPSSDGDGDGAPLIAHTLRGEGFDASEDGTGRGVPLVTAFAQNQREEIRTMQVSGALAAEPGMKQQTFIALQEVGKRTGQSTDDPRSGVGIGKEGDPMFTLQAGAQHGVAHASVVRRLTPLECERLQGFPDHYTSIPYGRPRHADQLCPDGPRYKALGNSMAVNAMRWLGTRIQAVEGMQLEA